MHWSKDTKFIEIDVRDSDLARRLAAAGYEKYLGISRSAATAARLQRELAPDKFVQSSERRCVLWNNADVLILSGKSPIYLWRLRDVRHAEWVVWKLSFHPILLIALLGWFVRFLARQYNRPVRLAYKDSRGCRQILLASRVVRRKRCYHDALHFIPHKLGLAGLFGRFHREQIDYTVLRWFESLPEKEPPGDIDLLIADDDLPRVLKMLDNEPAIRPCDLYTPSGLAESRYMKASYYPPEFARRLLANSQLHRNYCRVPNELDYFHSLAYHAVYHKGPRSGLKGSGEFRKRPAGISHDFTSILRDMAARLGIDAEISLSGLHAYLQRQNLAPSPDFIVRMAAGAPRNRWLAKLADQAEGDVSVDPGLVVFVIRQSAVDAAVDGTIEKMIECNGFIPLWKKRLAPSEIAHGAACTRGGNWGPGPRDHLGGLPAIVIVAYDPQPLRPTRAQQKRFPRVTNARTLVKEEIRREINRMIAPRPPINGLHSSDYGAEAHHFMSVFAPEVVATINDRIADLRREPARRAAA
jgi:hypothetical protein